MAIWRISTCKEEAGYCSSSSIYNLIRDGLWTRPVQLRERSVGWPDYEVKAICAARIAGKSIAEIKELVIELHRRRTKLFDELLSVDPNGSAMASSTAHDRHAPGQNEVAPVRTLGTKAGGAA